HLLGSPLSSLTCLFRFTYSPRPPACVWVLLQMVQISGPREAAPHALLSVAPAAAIRKQGSGRWKPLAPQVHPPLALYLMCMYGQI
ncbi:MAG: hypothetical protein ACK56I_34455, partial [bacterium]